MADIIVENSPMLSPKLKKQEDEGSILIAVQERELGNYATDAHKKKKKKVSETETKFVLEVGKELVNLGREFAASW